MKRGGLCFVGRKRYVKASTMYLDDYDESKPSNHIMYWDANNLYGGSMSKYLPYTDFNFIDPNLENFNNVLNTFDSADEGYTSTVDIVFPKEIHDKLREYPPALENCCSRTEWFSKYQFDLGLAHGAIKINDKTGNIKNWWQ